MKITLESLQELAQGHGLRVVERGAGHFQILDGNCLVNYYPHSKKRSAFIDGTTGKAQHGITPEKAFEMALGPAPAGARPRRMPAVDMDEPAKRTPREWAALLPTVRYAWSKEEFEERLARDTTQGACAAQGRDTEAKAAK